MSENLDRIKNSLKIGWSRLRATFRAELVNEENLPQGAFILACNYLHSTDALRVVNSLGRKVVSLNRLTAAKKETPTAREERALAELAKGRGVLIFPEGGPSLDGKLHRGRPEAVALAIRADVPLIPAALVKSRDPQIDYELRIGEPISLGRYRDADSASDAIEGFWLRGAADLMMLEISKLSGQRYSDMYPLEARELRKQQVAEHQQRAQQQWEDYQREQKEAKEAEEQAELAEKEELAQAAKAAKEYVQRIAEEEQATR